MLITVFLIDTFPALSVSFAVTTISLLLFETGRLILIFVTRFLSLDTTEPYEPVMFP